MGESVEFRGRIERITDGIAAVNIAGEARAEGRTGATTAVGDEAVVLVRPERIELSRGGAGADGVPGRVTDVLYMGQRSRYTVSVAGGAILHLTRENTVGTEIYPAGESISLRWSADDAVVLR